MPVDLSVSSCSASEVLGLTVAGVRVSLKVAISSALTISAFRDEAETTNATARSSTKPRSRLRTETTRENRKKTAISKRQTYNSHVGLSTVTKNGCWCSIIRTNRVTRTSHPEHFLSAGITRFARCAKSNNSLVVLPRFSPVHIESPHSSSGKSLGATFERNQARLAVFLRFRQRNHRGFSSNHPLCRPPRPRRIGLPRRSRPLFPAAAERSWPRPTARWCSRGATSSSSRT